MKSTKLAIFILLVVLFNITHAQFGGKALYFQNSNFMTHGDFVYCGSPNYSFTDKLTVAGWVKWMIDPKTFAVTPSNHEREGQYSTYIAYSSHNSDVNGQFWLRNAKTSNKYEFGVENASGTIVTASSTTAPVNGSWVFIAGVYDGSTVKIYINGTLEDTKTLSGNIKSNDGTHRLNMGRLPWGYGFFVGYLDEFRVWKAALSQSDIQSQMANVTSVKSSDLASYWSFNSGSGSIIDDSAPQNADGNFYTCLIDVHFITTSPPYTISDNDKTWVANNWAGYTLKTVAGAGIDETNTVSSNTSNVCTLNSVWTTTPVLDFFISGNTNVSWFGVEKSDETSQWVDSDLPMPVELMGFNANINNNSVRLAWSTATEVNNYKFEIERLKLQNELREINKWLKIGEIDGCGNSNSVKHYNFVDNGVTNGSYLYRLKQIDYDGNFKYSNELQVNCIVVSEFTLSQNFPNPFNPNTTLHYALASASNVKLLIYDITGKEIAVLVNKKQEAGKYTVDYKAQDLPSGIYMAMLKTNNFQKSIKMILLK